VARPAEPWRLAAACREHPTDWWFGTIHDRKRARAVCRGCAVRPECLEYALARPVLPGIWADTTSEERACLRLARAAAAQSDDLANEDVAAV
jgi:WhiB family redox-sensing transcriptional regulator